MIYSAINTGNPIIAIDSNYPSLSIGNYAQNQGYDVHVFAPSFGESDVCNPLDFLRDSSDAETARSLAILVNRYFWRLNKDDSFHPITEIELTRALLMLAKESVFHADILTAAAIIKSDNLIQRLMNADLNPWIKMAFDQLLFCASAPLTAAGIIANVRMIFSGLVVDNSLAWLIGQSTLPLQIEQRQMIILGMTSEATKAVNPLIWSIFELFLNRQINSNLIVACDELSFDYLSKHNHQQTIIVLPRQFHQEIPRHQVTTKNDKTISLNDELASRAKEIDFILPLVKI